MVMVLERKKNMNIIEQVEEYVKQKIEEYKNTSEDHYDFWNEHIKYVYNESLDLADKYKLKIVNRETSQMIKL